MSAHGLLERTRRASEIPLRTAHVERQQRELGDCAICGAPTLLHYRGPGAAGGWLGCDVARRALAHSGTVSRLSGERTRKLLVRKAGAR